MSLLVAALRYLALGWAVIPVYWPRATGCACGDPECKNVGKHPLVRWKSFQTERPTREQIEAWWKRWPSANIALVTGVVSRLCVLDVDVRSGGLETLAELDRVGCQMPDDNPCVITGSGGLHHYFALDRPLPKAAPWVGIEVQADGGLIVAPSSRHCAGSYRWARDPWTHPLPPLPSWVRAACRVRAGIGGLPRHGTARLHRGG